MMVDKKLLRQNLRKQRISMDPLYRKQASLKISQMLKKYLKRNSKIAVYRAMGSELNLTAFIAEAKKRKIELYEPVVIKHSRRLWFIQWGEKYKRGCKRYRIENMQKVIVPLIAIDQEGYRLGQGGGYYDSSFAYCQRKQAIKKIGVGFACQIVEKIPREKHDIPLDEYLGENGLKKYQHK